MQKLLEGLGVDHPKPGSEVVYAVTGDYTGEVILDCISYSAAFSGVAVVGARTNNHVIAFVQLM